MRYSIGLDVGISSVGYAVLALDSEDMPCRIERLGSRIFDAAEHPKNGDSLAKPRREARGARRRARRHRHRLERIRGLIVSAEILTKEQLFTLYDDCETDIYEIRTRALDEKISASEFARILIHLAQRRGYKSNRNSDADDADGKILSAVSENAKRCAEKGYRTVGEMFYRDELFKSKKRNDSANYICTVDRASIEAEAKLIFESQRNNGVTFASEETEAAYLEILLGQRSFAEGPACGPYSGNQVQRMRGKCTFEKGESRAAKASYSFQLFNLCQRINHIRLIKQKETYTLGQDERQIVFDLAHAKENLSYANIRTALKLPDDVYFVGISYDGDTTQKKAESSAKIKDLSIYHKIKSCLVKSSPDLFEGITHDQLDAIGEALSKNQSDDAIIADLSAVGLCESAISSLLTLPNFPKFGHLSVVACKKILPFLIQGMTYDKACDAAGYHAEEICAQKYLPPLAQDNAEIKNPVVKRAISQTIKVINAIIREMNESPVYVNVELARELAYDLGERKKIKKAQDENQINNEKALDQLKNLLSAPTGHDLVKYKLWQEQDGRCLYSGEPIEIARLNEPGYVDIDHIVPYSISFDDRMSNKVLVLAKENRQKGNRLPLQYLQGQKRDNFITLIEQSHLKRAKKLNLLKESISDEAEWKQRNLRDTQYISSYIYNYINDNLLFAPSYSGKKRRVTAVNGAITSYVRKRWGISKLRENGDLHHAVDAVVVACITQGMINRISKYSYYKETKDNGDYIIDETTGELITRFPMPWQHFRDELEIRMTQDAKNMRKMLFDVNYDTYLDVELEDVKPPFVSRMSNHKITGSAHLETVKSAKLCEVSNKTISKVSLSKLTLDKNGEIENYYNPDSDTLLYEALKKRLAEFGGKGEKAFADGVFYKPKSDGTNGPEVKKVKIIETSSSGVRLHGGAGIADNETMVRCDVFYVEGDGYYFVPIYVADTVKPELPHYAPTQTKDSNGQKKRKLMNDDDFVFSLYPNDLIKIHTARDLCLNTVNKKSTLPAQKIVNAGDSVFLYYKGMDVSVATLKGITHDNTYEYRSIGKTVSKIEKYEVDVLGNTRKIEKEKRQDFSNLKK